LYLLLAPKKKPRSKAETQANKMSEESRENIHEQAEADEAKESEFRRKSFLVLNSLGPDSRLHERRIIKLESKISLWMRSIIRTDTSQVLRCRCRWCCLLFAFFSFATFALVGEDKNFASRLERKLFREEEEKTFLRRLIDSGSVA
jgi:hypothetical protein